MENVHFFRCSSTQNQKQSMFVKHLAIGQVSSQKPTGTEVQSQGHKAVDINVLWRS